MLAWDPTAVIGRTSLPTLTVNGGWHSVWLVVVDVVVVVVVVELVEDVEDVEVEFVVVVEFVSLPANATGVAAAGRPPDDADWFTAYAAIPPETRTSIAATVRICSLPAFSCMLLRTCGALDAI